MEHPHKKLLLQFLDDTSTEFEYLHPSGYWFPCSSEYVFNDMTTKEIRIISTPDSINWDEVHKDYNWMARNAGLEG